MDVPARREIAPRRSRHSSVQPGLIFVQPRTGFHVASVHSIFEFMLIAPSHPTIVYTCTDDKRILTPCEDSHRIATSGPGRGGKSPYPKTALPRTVAVNWATSKRALENGHACADAIVRIRFGSLAPDPRTLPATPETASSTGSARRGRAGRRRSACRRSPAAWPTCSAAQAAAPQLMPHIRPSCLASCRAVSMASSSLHLDHLVDDVQVQHVGDEAGADALDRVLAGLERPGRPASG